MKALPFFDLDAVNGPLNNAVREAVDDLLQRGQWLLGEQLAAFEHEFAAYTDTRHCVGVGNGLDALTLCLHALDIGPGDEVIVPAHTFIATWLAVSRVGAQPVPVEPASVGFNIDGDAIEAALSARTRAIIPVHLYGVPADMVAIGTTADRHGLQIIEDAAQAHGARLGGHPVGSLGTMAAWSFYPSKNLGALGDAGAVTTNDPDLADRIRLLRNYGSPSRGHHLLRGVNSRMDDLQAAVLRIKLRRLDDWNRQRREIAERYREGLADLDVLRPSTPGDTEAVWHLYVIRSRARDALQAHLSFSGIGSLVHYPVPPHRQPAYASGGPWPPLPRTEAIAETVLSLPLWPGMTSRQVDRVITSIAAFGGAGSKRP